MFGKKENSKICTQCGGVCCHNSGCNYFASDFKGWSKEDLQKFLDLGRTSITAEMIIHKIGEKVTEITPILLLRARNLGRGVIDLVSFPNECASLESKGCHYDYEKRPGFGRGLIPQKNLNCYYNYNLRTEINNWLPYQDMLKEIIWERTGKDFKTLYLEDIQSFLTFYYLGFMAYVPQNIQNVIEGQVDALITCYPEIAEEALNTKFALSRHRW